MDDDINDLLNRALNGELSPCDLPAAAERLAGEVISARAKINLLTMQVRGLEEEVRMAQQRTQSAESSIAHAVSVLGVKSIEEIRRRSPAVLLSRDAYFALEKRFPGKKTRKRGQQPKWTEYIIKQAEAMRGSGDSDLTVADSYLKAAYPDMNTISRKREARALASALQKARTSSARMT